MRNLEHFLKTIYLGDRYCKCLLIDGLNKRISIQINTISRIRDPSGQWKFYTEEDIKDGFIVFKSVRHWSIEPQGLLPCDWIDIVSVEPSIIPQNNVKLSLFTISLGAIDEEGHSRELTMKIVAENIYLEDPLQPGVEITK